MKKKLFIAIFILIFLTACGMKYPELKENAIAFKIGEYIDLEDDEASYGTIEYNGRTYMPYSSLKGKINKENLKECIGYIMEDENVSKITGRDDKDTRVYTLAEDEENNYLMVYYVASEVMNQPSFWRAVDTRGMNINTPNYIDIPDANFWK